MINAKMFYEATKGVFREHQFDTINGEEGGPLDRPLVVQFAANDPEALLASARYVENHCDAVDINLGCPQEIAKRGRYGSFLQDDWDLIYSLINTLHNNLSIPVTAKFRIFPTIEKTVEYAKMLERAGAQIITCHGRLREQRGQNTGVASWEHIRAVKEAVSVPVFANGNILYHEDIQACLDATGCDGVMSAEGQLYNAALFASSPFNPSTFHKPESLPPKSTPLDGLHPYHTDLALEYLSIVGSLKTRTAASAIKGHMFKIMRPALAHEPDLRDKLGKIRASEGRDGRIGPEGLKEYVDVVKEMKERMDRAAKDAEDKSWDELITIEPTTGFKILPHWLSQPYFRPLKSKKPGEPKDTTSPLSRTKRERTTPEPAAVSASKRTKLDDSVTTNEQAN